MTTHPNDTYGPLEQAEFDRLKAAAATCIRCGMIGNIDPVLHENRYGHAPVVSTCGTATGPGAVLTVRWAGAGWLPEMRQCQRCAAAIPAAAILCGRCALPVIDMRQGPKDHACKGVWKYAGANRGGHETYVCDTLRHSAIWPHVNADHVCNPVACEYVPGA